MRRTAVADLGVADSFAVVVGGVASLAQKAQRWLHGPVVLLVLVRS